MEVRDPLLALARVSRVKPSVKRSISFKGYSSVPTSAGSQLDAFLKVALEDVWRHSFSGSWACRA